MKLKVEEAKNFTDKTLGLIKRNNPVNLLIKTRFGIHTFFLKESIDITILNKNSCVVKIKEGLHPYRVFLWNPKYDIVIESPAGTIKKMKIRTGVKVKTVS